MNRIDELKNELAGIKNELISVVQAFKCRNMPHFILFPKDPGYSVKRYINVLDIHRIKPFVTYESNNGHMIPVTKFEVEYEHGSGAYVSAVLTLEQLHKTYSILDIE